jgi:hypothetical protein
MTKHLPLLSDLAGIRRYEAGDRILSRVTVQLSAAQRQKLAHKINLFCGCDVDLLVVNAAEAQLLLVRRNAPNTELVGYRPPSFASFGTNEIDVTKVELHPTDRLFLRASPSFLEGFKQAVQRWAGEDIEVVTTGVMPR